MSAAVRMHLLRAAILGVAGLVGPLAAAAQGNGEVSGQVALHDALVLYQNSWGVDLSYEANLLVNRWTNWDRPQAQSAEEDLRALLEGTGVTCYRLTSGTFGLKEITARFGIITGFVYGYSSGAPLSRAHVYEDESLGGAVTNLAGHFVLEDVDPGEVIIKISHVGYALQREQVVVLPGQHSALTVRMRELPILHFPLVIYGMEDVTTPRLANLDVIAGEATNQIGGLGAADLVHSIGEVAGVAVDEASSDIHIQGGNQGEHQFLLDGSRVYDPAHLHGLLGSFNPFAIGRVSVFKAGFAASKGSYLAGVINAEHALQDSSRHLLEAHLDPMSLNAQMNAGVSLGKGVRASILGAVRASVWNGWWSFARSPNIDRLLLNWNAPDPFLLRASLYPLKALRPDLYDAFTDRLDNVAPPDLPEIDFYDVHLASKVHFRSSHALSASFYRGGNRLHGRRLIATLLDDADHISKPDKYDWFNSNGRLAWSFLASDNVFVNAEIRNSHYVLTHKYSGLDRQNAVALIYGRLFFDLIPTDDGNKIRETSLASTVEYDHGIGLLNAGFEYIQSHHRFVVRDIFPQGIDHARDATRIAFYAEEKFTFIPRVEITAGSRLTYLGSQDRFYAEPRLDLRYRSRVGRRGAISFRVAAGVYYQFLNQFDVGTISPSTLIPSTRFWLPVDGTLPPPKAYHLASDIGIQFLAHWSFHAEGYYKHQPRLFRIDYPRLWQPETEHTLDEEPVSITTQAGFVALSKGFAYGGAFVLERAAEKLRLLARYEYNISEREYGFRGEDVRLEPVPWSEPHLVHLSARVNPLRHLQASVRWRGSWGRVWGFRQAYYDFLGTDTDQGLTFGGIDFRQPTDLEHQLNPFKQLDLGFAFTTTAGPGDLQIRADILNVTNRRNEADRNLLEVIPSETAQIEEETSGLIRQSRHLLGRALSISLRLRW